MPHRMVNNNNPASGNVSQERSFYGLGIAPKILDILVHIKFKVPTPIQFKAIPPAIEGKDVIGIAQTGTGIGKMKKLMKEYGLSQPSFSEEGDFFVVKFYGPQEKILDLVSSIPKERQVDLREMGLNTRQIETLRLMVNEKKKITTKEYCQRFNVSRNTAYLDLNELVKKNMSLPKGQGRSLYYIAK